MKRLQTHLVLSMLALAVPSFLHAQCKLKPIARLPITMDGLRPIISAKVNGSEAKFVADSGAFYNIMTPAGAAELKLRLQAAPGYALLGAGGKTDLSIARVKEFTVAGTTLPNLEFVVGGIAPGGGAVGVLGQNVFRAGDVEYSLADGAIRLIRPEGCKDTPLAFWAPGKPYSEIQIEAMKAAQPRVVGPAYVNEKEIRVMFDTGAPMSVLSLDAAGRAGVKPGGAGVVFAGYGQWIAPFASFKIGDEEIHNTRLRIGPTVRVGIDMLIGADFFLSHHIYIANSQGKLYFTYNGGPVFNLTSNAHAGSDSSEAASASPKPSPDTAAEAERLAQQGRVESARGELEQAIADLTKACELQPDVAAYFFERGRARLATKQTADALADFRKAIELDPNDVAAHMALAELHRAAKRNDEALAQLDAIDHLIPKDSDQRLELGALYDSVDRSTEAVTQYDLWIAARKTDVRMALALSARCSTRANSGRDLGKALADCNAALRLAPTYTNALKARGLVLLRQGRFDRAIADYGAVIKASHHDAWSLYGRGLAELRSGKSGPGRTDLDAATAIDAHIPDAFAKVGLSP
jgi:tetratricopeptide (TPR) repeat protein